MPGPILKAFYKHSPTNPHKTLLAGNEDACLGDEKKERRRGKVPAPAGRTEAGIHTA